MSRTLHFHSSLLFLPLVAFFGGCHPLAQEGESCEDAPCVAGLVCFDEVCIAPSEPEPVVVECEVANDCAIEGSTSGRDCVDGQCVFMDCFVDAQCGDRICKEGQCADAVSCSENTDCKEEERCIDGLCRAPCQGDGDCGGAFEVCQDGECVTQCVIDLLCFGGLCEEGVCTDPQCADDGDCDALQACNSGRCESYTPCVIDEDCFDPDFLCNEEQRCEERPVCAVDADCGVTSICRSGHCRPVDACSDNSSCDDDEECLAGRCVNQPGCRADSDCDGGNVCAGSRCVPPELASATTLVVETAHGLCRADGSGACSLVLFAGEQSNLRVGAFSESGEPTLATLTSSLLDENVGTVAANGSGLTLSASATGETSLVLSGVEGASHDALAVRILPSSTVALAVLVVDGLSGLPLEGAEVMAGDTISTTAASGVASFLVAPSAVSNPSVGVFIAGHVGQWLMDAPMTGVLRFVLEPFSATTQQGAGYRVDVESTGDELGPVGIGIAIAPLQSAEDASLENVFGGVFNTAVEVPILGSLPVPLPAAVSLSTSLPLVGAQVVKDFSFVTSTGGPTLALVLEQRDEQQALFNLILGGDVTDIALNLAAASEGMDADIAFLGALPAVDFLADGDNSDGVTDVDGDGDVNELVPDYFAAEPISARPSVSPAERVGLIVPQLPASARASALATMGHDVVGVGFVPHGVGVVNARGDGQTQQVKVIGPNAAWSTSSRRVAVHAVFDDAARSSFAHVSLESFGPTVSVPALLDVPEGTLLLEGVPAPGDRLVALPTVNGASTFFLTFDDGVVEWQVAVPATDSGGRSIQLPASIVGSTLLRVQACDLAGLTPGVATLAHFETGMGPSSKRNIQACSTLDEVQR
ncbi:MAG: hypothetical protein GY822_29165 [Deltaproteobacteria bacterium]|nr:hypothetical protein [Deltaproteobacteria bacterium]